LIKVNYKYCYFWKRETVVKKDYFSRVIFLPFLYIILSYILSCQQKLNILSFISRAITMNNVAFSI